MDKILELICGFFKFSIGVTAIVLIMIILMLGILFGIAIA